MFQYLNRIHRSLNKCTYRPSFAWAFNSIILFIPLACRQLLTDGIEQTEQEFVAGSITRPRALIQHLYPLV